MIPLEAETSTTSISEYLWQFENPDLWEEKNGTAILLETREEARPFRRPFQLGYIRTENFLEDFEYKAQVKCTDPELKKGRDILIVFGYQSPTRFYYVHLSNNYAPDYHNGIFLVNKSARTRIDKEGLEGPTTALMTDLNWHDILLKRIDGTTSITIDGQLLMTTDDRTIDRGYVGFGSFDDTGEIRNIELKRL